MTHLHFTVILPPVAQQRSRSRAIIPVGANKPLAMNYKSGKQRKNDNKLEALLYEHRPPLPFEGQILLGVKAYLPMPESRSKKWKVAAVSGEIRPTTRPDLDNLLKQLKDCMTGIFWIDDKLVVGYLPGTGKYYGDPARWEIELAVFPRE